MSKFPWGQVLDRFSYDFDGVTLEVTKFHPHKFENHRLVLVDNRPVVDESKVQYHSAELSESWDSMSALLVSWIARRNLGDNQHTLVAGVQRALGIVVQ